MNLNITPPDLTDYQREILYCGERFTLTEACTKAGKTFSHLWWVYERAHMDWNRPGFYHWWVAPVYSQAKIAFDRLRILVGKSGAYKINETALSITTPLGSIIQFKTAKDPNNLYGEDVHSAVFDEAPRAKQEAWHALRSTLTATGAPCKLIGNFGGVANWMHLLKKKALDKDSEYRAFKITAEDAIREGILTRKEIDQARIDLPPKVFASLYMAEEQEDEDMLCSYDAIRDLWTNTHAKAGEKYITADIALHGSDRFILLVWDGWRIIDFKEVAKCEADEVTEIIKSVAEAHSVPRRNIVYDADGLGSFLRGYLKGAKPFNNGAAPIVSGKSKINYKNLKSQCGYKMASKVNAAGVLIDCAIPEETFIREMECLRSWELDKEGKIQLMPKAKIKEILGVSPDWLDALIMRMYFEVKPKSRAPRATMY